VVTAAFHARPSRQTTFEGILFLCFLFPVGLMSPLRSILLVGEGNFSFSASVSQLESEASITATCPQHQEEALRHDGAAENITTVRDSGRGLGLLFYIIIYIMCGTFCTRVCACVLIRWGGAFRGGLHEAGGMRLSPGLCV